MKTIDVLKKARKLIAKGWTQLSYARDIHGQPVEVMSSKACYFCADGALRRVVGKSDCPGNMPRSYKLALRDLGAVMGGIIPEINDQACTSKKTMLAGFDKAIAKAKR